jgi:hypothetical protein
MAQPYQLNSNKHYEPQLILPTSYAGAVMTADRSFIFTGRLGNRPSGGPKRLREFVNSNEPIF